MLFIGKTFFFHNSLVIFLLPGFDTLYLSSSLYSVFNVLLTGGDEQIRTVDPLLARQVLSQLSYTPIFSFESHRPSKLNSEQVGI